MKKTKTSKANEKPKPNREIDAALFKEALTKKAWRKADVSTIQHYDGSFIERDYQKIFYDVLLSIEIEKEIAYVCMLVAMTESRLPPFIFRKVEEQIESGVTRWHKKRYKTDHDPVVKIHSYSVPPKKPGCFPEIEPRDEPKQAG